MSESSGGFDLALSLASDADGKTLGAVLHRADCPLVRRLAAQGVPVMTMIGCLRMPDRADRTYTWHSCLSEH